MENNSPLDDQLAEDLHISGRAESFLKETAKWARFLSILGFIGIGFLVLVALFIGAFMNVMGGDQLPFPSFVLTFVYLLIAALYFFPVLYLFRFATYTQRALRTADQSTLDDAFSNMKSHYKFIGILAVVVLAFYVLGLVVTLIGGAGMFMGR